MISYDSFLKAMGTTKRLEIHLGSKDYTVSVFTNHICLIDEPTPNGDFHAHFFPKKITVIVPHVGSTSQAIKIWNQIYMKMA